MFGYRTADLALVAAFCTTSGAAGAGIWQSGAGLVGAPDGSIYFATGNDGLLPGSPPPGDPGNLGDSIVRLQAIPQWPGLQLAGHFTPQNAAFLRDGYGTAEQPGDTDLGSGGPTLLPGNTLIMGGKQGRIYVLDPATMHASTRQERTPGATATRLGARGREPAPTSARASRRSTTNTWAPIRVHRGLSTTTPAESTGAATSTGTRCIGRARAASTTWQKKIT